MRIGIIISILFASVRLLAQDKGDLPDVTIQIINPLKVTLPKAERNFSQVPAMPVEPITPPIVYDYSIVSFSTPSFSPPVRPLRIKPTETQATSANFVSAGFGNFASPYLKGYISFFPAKSSTVGGLSLVHHSFGKGPVDGKNSSNGTTGLTANVKSSNNSLSTEALAGFEIRSANFYGYAPATTIEKDTIGQQYQTYFFSGKISNSKKSDFNYEFRPAFSYIRDDYFAKESDLGLALNSHYQMKGRNALLFNASYSLLARKDSAIEAKPRHLFEVTPQYQFSPVENLIVKAGLTVVFENDSIGKKDLHIYPAGSATYSLGKNFGLFANLSGDMEKVSLHSLSGENIWLNSRVAIFHTNKTFDFSGGINGDLGSGFNFVSGFAFSRLKDYFLFQNDSLNEAKFNTVYDDVTRSNFFTAINFDKGNYSFRIKGDVFGYSTGGQQEAWHRPRYKLDAYVVIKAANKLSIIPRLMILGGMKALDFKQPTDVVVSLPAAVDLSANVEYNFSGKIGMFVKLNNLLNSDYRLYNQYPVRGFQALVGFTWKF
jgi:hypothetical protein